MSKPASHNAELVQGDLLRSLNELTPLSASKRGRPSRKAIEQMIVAPRNKLLESTGASSPAQSNSLTEVKTAIGVCDWLNIEKKITLFSILAAGPGYRKQDPEVQPAFDEPVTHRSHNFLQRVFDKILKELDGEHDYFGFAEPKALQALSVSGALVKAFLNRKPGYDVYFTNTEVHAECLYENSWAYGETLLPGYMQFAEKCMRNSGVDPRILKVVTVSGVMASMSLIFANKVFWLEFIQFLRIFLPAVQGQSTHMQSNHFRLFSSLFLDSLLAEFLRHSGSRRSFKFKSHSLEKDLDPHLVKLRAMKDLACQSKNQWLFECWEGYRSLYQSSVAYPTGATRFVLS
jgi:hypothetical protein